MKKFMGFRNDPRKRNPSSGVTIRLHKKHTEDFLDHLRSLGASQISAYGNIVFMTLPPRMVLCVVELPEVLYIEQQGGVPKYQ